jgi:hypothetical protein
LSDFFFSHLLVTNSDGHAGNLLKLELNGGSGIVDLLSKVFLVRHDLWEHTNSVEDGSQHSWNLLDK